ncbi:MerR family transcriptional regulator [Streptomyces sp. NPDC093085]|uniref:MerR family transcriptional regulator n=1 Tax=Streptomyces sp. NPDC093085 TaxID=3155068 RepID=UPI00343BA2DB
MRIGELAKRAGTTTRALRYYESRGLLPARRAVNGYRAYDESDLRLLRQIRTLQECGFDLEETRPFVECLRAGHPAGDSCPASLAVYRRKLTELDGMIEQLRSVRAQIGEQLARADAARAGLAAEAEHPGGPEPLCELTVPDATEVAEPAYAVRQGPGRDGEAEK